MTYQKIPGPFKRDPKSNLLLFNEWTSPALAAVAWSSDWFFTEKVDGTNVRIIWDGHRVSYLGRTDTSTFSSEQDLAVRALFYGEDKETLFEQQFGAMPVTLYGELYGPKIQSGGSYRDDITFALFDVRIDDMWLLRDSVEDIAHGLDIDVVPIVLGDEESVDLLDGINFIEDGFYSRIQVEGKEPRYAEGIVGQLRSGIRDRRGERIIVKLKHRDLFSEE
jgi:hypothetical protein